MSATQTALKKAMQAANAAVALDQAGDTRGALTAYRGALNQMREVIARKWLLSRRLGLELLGVDWKLCM